MSEYYCKKNKNNCGCGDYVKYGLVGICVVGACSYYYFNPNCLDELCSWTKKQNCKELESESDKC